MGEWAAGRGIRNYPYSTNMTVNPSTYKVRSIEVAIDLV
jgi:extracellular elastinolytic metalloproteinase